MDFALRASPFVDIFVELSRGVHVFVHVLWDTRGMRSLEDILLGMRCAC